LREYPYSIIKSVDRINNMTDPIIINGVTVHHIDQLGFKEYDNEYVVMSLLNQSKEVASVKIYSYQKLVINESNNSYMIMSS